jgi:hypothetical protein
MIKSSSANVAKSIDRNLILANFLIFDPASAETYFCKNSLHQVSIKVLLKLGKNLHSIYMYTYMYGSMYLYYVKGMLKDTYSRLWLHMAVKRVRIQKPVVT